MFERLRVRKLSPQEAHVALRRALKSDAPGRPSRLLALAERAVQVEGDDPMARAARASAHAYLSALRAGRRVKTSAHGFVLLEPIDPALAIEVDHIFGEDDTFWSHELGLNDPRGDTDPEQ